MGKEHPHDEQADVPLSKVMLFNWLLLLPLAGGGWLLYSGFVALSVLAGGVVANLSFLFLKRDLGGLLRGPLEGAKAQFFIRYYLRLAVVVVVLFLLVKYRKVHIGGLLVGLSTVLLSIGLAVAIAVRKIYRKDLSKDS